jgi:hypothetical protein
VIQSPVLLEYKWQSLGRRLLGISGISGSDYPIFFFFAVLGATWTVAPLSFFTSLGGPYLLGAEAAFLAMMICIGIFLITTAVFALPGILIL